MHTYIHTCIETKFHMNKYLDPKKMKYSQDNLVKMYAGLSISL